MRKSLIFLSFVILINFVSAIQCTDSDNSKDYLATPYSLPINPEANPDFYIKGNGTGDYKYGGPAVIGENEDNSIRLIQNGPSIFYDYCVHGSNLLAEALCTSDGELANVGADCPNGCEDGACIKGTATIVDEKITCVFKNSNTKQRCDLSGFSNLNGGVFYCEGVNDCSINLRGVDNSKITWLSTTCNPTDLVFKYTTMDGTDESVTFECGTSSQQPPVQPPSDEDDEETEDDDGEEEGEQGDGETGDDQEQEELVCTSGCELENDCVNVGYRKSGEYCAVGGEFISQLGEDSQCDNDFECSSNLCIDDKCISSSLFQKILEWFKGLFGNEDEEPETDEPETTGLVCKTDINEIADSDGWVLLGPSDGRINTVERSQDGTLFIGSNSGGIFRSLDNGDTWEHYSNGLDSSNINYLKFINEELYAATGDGVYVLKDSSWKNVLKPSSSDRFMFIDYDSTKDKIWALSQYGLYNSEDGENWNEIEIPETSSFYNSASFSKDGSIYISDWFNLYQSTDEGVSWAKIIETPFISYIIEGEGNLYLIALYKLYKVIDNQNLQEISLPVEISGGDGSAKTTYKDGKLFLPAGRHSFGILEIDTETFYKIDSPKPHLVNNSEAFWDVRQMYPIENDKVILTHDNGVSEVDINTGLSKKYGEVRDYSEVTSLDVNNDLDLFLTTYWDHGGAYSTDGLNWKQTLTLEQSIYFLEPKEGKTFLRITGTTQRGLISLVSSEKVENEGYEDIFTKASYLIRTQEKEIVSFDKTKTPTTAYVLTTDSKLLSFDMTVDVNKINFQERNLSVFPLKITIDSKGGILILGINLENDNQVIYKSEDGGESWNEVISLPSRIYLNIRVSPIDDEILVMSAYSEETDFLGYPIWDYEIFSIKNGEIRTINLPPEIKSKGNELLRVDLAYDDVDSNILYIGSAQGFFYSEDGGNTWKEFNDCLYSEDIRVIIPKGDKIFIGTWGSGNAVILKEKILENYP